MLLYEPGLICQWGIFQVPVIALFTKYDQFRRDIKMRLEDEYYEYGRPEIDLDVEVERVFRQRYLAGLSGHQPFICLESEDSDFVSDNPIFC